MKTIVEPQQHIKKLWSIPQSLEGTTFRLMRYVIRAAYEDDILLHNVITGELVVLDKEENKITESLPMQYSVTMKQLVEGHFLVPVDFDECQLVKRLQLVLRKLEGSQKKPIKWYTILPTTACNARCYYCFEHEHGMQTVTMTKQTADKVVEFIDKHCGEDRRIYITWFGGEPTVAANRIDQICEGLRLREIEYKSSISTNGYLFDEEMAYKAKHLWNLQFAQICFDGVETSYNKIKNFVGVKDNPYQRVLRNVGLLLDQGIRVGLRMNFDIDTCTEFDDLIEESIKRFGFNRNLHVNAYPIIGEHEDRDGKINHGSDAWLIETYTKMNALAKERGVATEKYELPYLTHIGCDADNPMAVNITAEGALVRCCERFNKEEWVGNISDGITNPELVESWTKVASYQRCEECVMYPRCLRLVNCVAKDRCYFELEKKRKATEAMLQAYKKWLQ